MYRVPRGGLFAYVSCANYLGELVQWSGWAVATWSTAGLLWLLFALSTFVPRARATHAWCTPLARALQLSFGCDKASAASSGSSNQLNPSHPPKKCSRNQYQTTLDRRYHEKFADYPSDRKALIPFIW